MKSEGSLGPFGDSITHSAALDRVNLRFASQVYLEMAVGGHVWPGGEAGVNCTIKLSVPSFLLCPCKLTHPIVYSSSAQPFRQAFNEHFFLFLF